MKTDAVLTLGPILFHWPAEVKRDFYFRIADEAPVETVYLGEVVCSKRSPFFDREYPAVIERLESAGKTIVISTLAEIVLPRERKMVAELCQSGSYLVEANDPATLYHLRGKPHCVGPLMNAYNEDSLAFLAGHGAVNFALPPELPARSLQEMAAAASLAGTGLEVQVYGRLPLAISARCYHARAHGRVKDNCQFVCEHDPDGMVLATLEQEPFLAVNGVQTLSYKCLNLAAELARLSAMGINRYRLSPQGGDMVGIAGLFRDVAANKISSEEASAKLREMGPDVPFCNGFFYGKGGHEYLRE